MSPVKICKIWWHPFRDRVSGRSQWYVHFRQWIQLRLLDVKNVINHPIATTIATTLIDNILFRTWLPSLKQGALLTLIWHHDLEHYPWRLAAVSDWKFWWASNGFYDLLPFLSGTSALEWRCINACYLPFPTNNHLLVSHLNIDQALQWNYDTDLLQLTTCDDPWSCPIVQVWYMCPPVK